MSKPPPSGPHSDLAGVNRDARVGAPTVDPGQGDAGDIAHADAESAAQPDQQPQAANDRD